MNEVGEKAQFANGRTLSADGNKCPGGTVVVRIVGAIHKEKELIQCRINRQGLNGMPHITGRLVTCRDVM